MAKFDGVIGQELIAVTEKEDELTLVFRDNRYLFVKVLNGKLSVEAIPE